MGDGTYSVEELEQVLDIPARTIHFWVQSKLLEGPGAGRGARYTDEHLARLFMIRRLRDEGRPLSEIGAAVKRLSAADLNVLAEQARGERKLEKPRAKELIRRWLSRTSGDEAPEFLALAPDRSPPMAASAPRAMRRVESQSWTRVPLTSDVELHVRHPLSPGSQRLVDALLALARRANTEE